MEQLQNESWNQLSFSLSDKETVRDRVRDYNVMDSRYTKRVWLLVFLFGLYCAVM